MATPTYINGRKRYTRPQAILWSENPGTLTNGFYVPVGQEIGASTSLTTGGINQFLILSDHNRSDLSFKPTRIEQRERMINGNMRSYHIADKLNISFSWQNLPSRSYSKPPTFDENGIPRDNDTSLKYANDRDNNNLEFTADGGAGGVELLDWYENHKGSFWMFLSYDKYSNFGKDASAYTHLAQYNEVVEVYFSDFSYDVVKRGGSASNGRNGYDFWNVSVNLEEV